MEIKEKWGTKGLATQAMLLRRLVENFEETSRQHLEDAILCVAETLEEVQEEINKLPDA